MLMLIMTVLMLIMVIVSPSSGRRWLEDGDDGDGVDDCDDGNDDDGWRFHGVSVFSSISHAHCQVMTTIEGMWVLEEECGVLEQKFQGFVGCSWDELDLDNVDVDFIEVSFFFTLSLSTSSRTWCSAPSPWTPASPTWGVGRWRSWPRCNISFCLQKIQILNTDKTLWLFWKNRQILFRFTI